MSVECSECERDMRGGHAVSCSRHKEHIRQIREQIASEQEEYGNADAAVLMIEVDALRVAFKKLLDLAADLDHSNHCEMGTGKYDPDELIVEAKLLVESWQ